MAQTPLIASQSLPLTLIDEFLDGYEPSNLGRAMTAEERALAEEVLFDFIVTDLATETPSACSMALPMIRDLILNRASHLVDEIEPLLRVIESASRRTTCQLKRRERSFDIMRENLVMLAAHQF